MILGLDLRSGGLNRWILQEILIRIHWAWSRTPTMTKHNIEVRGFPLRRIFSWARWGWGPGQIPEVFGRRRCRIFLKNAKTEIDDESYLEKRLGIVKHGFIHGFAMRIFSKKTQKK